MIKKSIRLAKQIDSFPPKKSQFLALMDCLDFGDLKSNERAPFVTIMATGDLRNNVLKLQQELKTIKYKNNFDLFGYFTTNI